MSTTTSIKTTRKRTTLGPAGIVVQKTPYGMGSSGRMSMGGGGVSVRRSNVLSSSMGPMMGSTEASKVSRETVESVKGMRGKEKKDMCDLNGRLAEYLEKVRVLETTNKALYQQLEELRKLKGITGERVRVEYEDELEETRNALKETTQELTPLRTSKLELEDKIDTLEAEIVDLTKTREDLLSKIEKLNQMLGDIEGENAALKRNIEHAQTERDICKKDLVTSREDNSRLREDLQAARNRQIDAENERESLTTDLEFLRDSTDKEIEELREFIKKLQALQPKMESMYKSGVKDVMNEMQMHYQNQLDEMRSEMEMRYEERCQSMMANARRDNTDGISKQENKTLKSQMSDHKRILDGLQMENDRLKALIQQLRDQKDKDDRDHDEEMSDMRSKVIDLEADLAEITALMDNLKSSKLDLELEITCYRKLLDGEENKMRRTLEDSVDMQSRGAANLSSIITGGGGGGGSGSGSGSGFSSSSSQQQSNPVKSPVPPSDTRHPGKPKKPAMSQSTGRIQLSKTSKIAVIIADVDQSGRFLGLHNSSKTKEYDLSDYVLTRTFGRSKVAKYVFGNFSLPPNKTVKVLSYNSEDEKNDREHEGSIILVASQKECKTWGHGSGEVSLDDRDGKRKADTRIVFMTD